MYATYCLKLKNNCYYVGKTSYLKQRLTSHFKGKGAEWTKAHPPVEVVCVVEGDHESSMYRYAERKYGRTFVRGGHRTKVSDS